jgi:outer membrane receptor for ferrienterochelin and colicin
VKGIELEGKKSITKWLELKANVTYVYSKTVYYNSGADRISRTMLGQAPYVINGMLVYKADSIGLTATLSYNLQGPRLVITGYTPKVPNVYEMQRHVLDFKVSKTLGKHFSVNFTMRDLLNAPVRRAYKLGDQSLNVNYDYFRYGTNYILGIIYKI